MVKSNKTHILKGVFMNTIYYELKHTKEYNRLVHLVDQSYTNNTSIRTLWKQIKPCKNNFKSKESYRKLRRMVVAHLNQNRRRFKYLIDDESYCKDKDVDDEHGIDEYDYNDGFLVKDNGKPTCNRAFYWGFD